MARKRDVTKTSGGFRICHLADVHLGYRRYNKLSKGGFNQREVDVNLAFKEAIDRIIRVEPRVTIIAGDLFHSVRPSNAVINFAFREIRRLVEQTKAPLIIVAGNHETPRRVDTGSILRLYAEISGVFIADSGVEKFRFPDLGLNVMCLPHACLSNRDELTIRADDTVPYNVLVAHAQVNQDWQSDFGGIEIDLKFLKPHEWNYVALGHIHRYREIALNAAYSGAIEHTSINVWSEGSENKGFLEIDLATGKKTFHALTSPREVVVLDSIDAAGLEPLAVSTRIDELMKAVPGGVDGKLVRLEVLNLSRETYRGLSHKSIREWRSKALNLTLEIKAPAQFSTINLSAAKLKNLPAALLEFCKSREKTVNPAERVAATIQRFLDQLEVNNEAR